MEDLRPTIKLMADYDCWPLWKLSEMENIDPKTLPLLATIQQSLDSWAQSYDSTLNRDDPLQSVFETPEAANAFNAEGWRLWACLRQELPNCRVVYFDNQLGKVFEERPSGMS